MARTLLSMRLFRRVSLTWGGALLFSACGITTSATNSVTCTDPTGSPWVPNVTGVSMANHDSNATVASTTSNATGPVLGFAQAATGAKETAVSFTVGSDLGTYGSLALEATITSMPSGQSIIYPMLVSLVDPNGKEWINLARTGAGGDCAASGFFTSGGARNTACTVSFPSAYRTRDHWEQSQLEVLDDSPSVNIFPTCNWAGGSTATNGDPACAFNSDFFSGGKLPTGSYTARYVMLSGTSSTVSSGNAGLRVKVIQKTDTAATSAFDINVVIVGSSNVAASRTAKGQLNLDTLMKNVVALYNTSSTPIRVGVIRAYEWGCSQGGDSYAQVATSSMGDVIRTGATLLPSDATTGAVTLYLTQSFTDAPGVVGISASIGGPLEATYLSSGVIVPTFGKLESFNPNCSTTCPVTSQDADFADLGPTVAHEMGHYFGLNHPSESAGSKHDPLQDTPICTATNASGKISIGTCLNTDTNVYPATSQTCNASCPGYSAGTGTYCPTALACQFNHLMYWSTKNFTEGAGTGDGNLISDQARLRVLAHPLIQ